MIFYSSPQEEAGALRRAVMRAGCALRSVGIGDVPGAGRRALGHVECEDGWGAARLVLALAVEDSKTVGAREIARDLRARAPSDGDFACELQAFVKRTIRFKREVGEIFQGPAYVFARGEGDCEDHARAVYAIARAGGLPARLAFLHKGGDPTHAVAQLFVEGEPAWAETTVDAAFGEHPVAAARRLGLRHERGDIAEEVVTMTDQDLAAIPSGFYQANDPAQVEQDAQALVRLGYLCEGDIAQRGDPTDLAFRRAVLTFQRCSGIVADGLVGPQTRRTLAGALPLDDFGMGYIQSTTSPVYTKDLSSAFFRAVKALADRFRSKGSTVSGEDFLSVWLGESGILLARQGHGGLPYYGLNMMHEKNVRAAGWGGRPIEEYKDLPAEDQIPYVERFYEQNSGGKWSAITGARDLYFINFLPAWWYAHRDDPSWVIAEKDGKNAWVYRDNPAFDIGKKGYIEVADIDRWIEQNKTSPSYRNRWPEALARLRSEGGEVPSSSSSAATVAGIVILIGVSALAAHYLT